AMDDGGGAFISWSVLSILRQLNLRPKRTVRCVLWSCEEFGGVGAEQYFEQHRQELEQMDLVLESDLGVFHPLGLEFAGNAQAFEIMQSIGEQLLVEINATQVVKGDGGTDIGPWMDNGVPGGSLLNENEKYFMFHHSNGDTMTVLNSTDMDLAAAVWTVHAYVVADLDDMLPR
ncbi:unnamed protein product, partial [Didymodactylos carnosus]